MDDIEKITVFLKCFTYICKIICEKEILLKFGKQRVAILLFFFLVDEGIEMNFVFN